jgi:hypothetical protein
MNDAWVALLSALSGGLFIKMFEAFALPKSVRIDFQTKLRDELRQEIRELKKDVEHLQQDLDNWKLKYYDLLAKYNDLLSRIQDMDDHHTST